MTDSRTSTAASRVGRYRYRWLGLSALLIAEAMNLLDATIVQVAAPTMHADLGGSTSDIQWFTAAYTLPFAVLLISGARLGDIFGRRRVFRIGVSAFLFASLACALAPSAGSLIAFRALQGAAAALIIPQTIGLIRMMFDGDGVARALGTIGPVMGLAGVAGPVLGGVLTHVDLFGTSWRAVFCVNLPLAVAVLAVSPSIVENRAPRRPGLDPLGTLLLLAGAVLVIVPLVDPGPAVRTAALLGTGALLLVGFGWHQGTAARAHRATLVETSLFRARTFPAALITSTLFFAVMNGLILIVVVHLQIGLHAGALRAGLTLVPWSVGLGVASYVSGSRLVPRFGRHVMTVGLVIEAIGIALAVAAYLGAAPTRYPTLLLPALAVCGLGIGLFSPAFFTLALSAAAPQEVGSAAGLLNAVQQFGATLGVAVMGSVFFARTEASGAAHGAATACGLAGAVVVVALVATTFMRPRSA